MCAKTFELYKWILRNTCCHIVKLMKQFHTGVTNLTSTDSI